MPVINRQSPGGKPSQPQKQSSGVLSRIAPVKAEVGSIMLSLYGRPKTGKTRLACTFPKPALIIGAEDGTASVIGTKGLDFVMLEKCCEITEVIQGPVASGKYATVILDNGTKFRDMRISEILGLEHTAVQKGWGFAGRDQWTECSNSMKGFLRPLLDMGKKRFINIVIIAQEQNFNEESDSASDSITPSIGPALGKSVCDWINAECDYICHTLIREQTVTVTSKVQNKEVKTLQKTGKKEFCLRVAPHEIYQVGFRVPLGRTLDTEFIVDPNYEKIIKLIKG